MTEEAKQKFAVEIERIKAEAEKQLLKQRKLLLKLNWLF